MENFAPAVVEWLKRSLQLAFKDERLKHRIKKLLGAPRFIPNLDHFGLWSGLIQDCEAMALELGQDMQKHFINNHHGTVLGKEAMPNVYGKVDRVRAGGLLQVLPCEETRCVARQDRVLSFPDGDSFPQNPAVSQLYNEKCFIHFIRMIGMGVDASFQKAVEEVCTSSKGEFKGCAIKGFVRMKNKCTSKDDHYYEKYPRPSHNIDINRNACTFDGHEDLLSFVEGMKKHPMFGGHPVRIKNMFLFDDERAKKQFFYRTVMINWLYTPGITHGELAEQAKLMWERYRDYQSDPRFGDKDPSESWSTWRKQIESALCHLRSDAVKDKQVQFIVETQLLLRPYLIGRQKMHLIYKVCRAEDPEALHSDFRVNAETETRSFNDVQSDALQEQEIHDSFQNGETTQLWIAAEQGHEETARKILRNHDIDPNKVHDGTQTSPLYIAAYHGHVEIVKALLRHSKIQVNRGKLDTATSPLFAATQEGREEVVRALVSANGVDVNQTTEDGVSPLCEACELGHEFIVDLILGVDGVDTRHKLADGATALSLAARHGYVKAIESIVAHSRAVDPRSGKVRDPRLVENFPEIVSFELDTQYRDAVLVWAKKGANNRRITKQGNARLMVFSPPPLVHRH
jgi:ankyrin repeat protein